MKRKLMMKLGIHVTVLASILFLSGYTARAVTIEANADAKVRLSNDTNYGSEQSAVVGRDSGAVINRLYVGFSLPTLDPGYEYASATLYGYYYWDTWDSTDRDFSWYLVAEADDNWNESTITGNNAPSYSGSAIATWTPTGTSSGAGGHAYNEWQNWDILSALTSDTDGIMTLVLKQTDETLKSGLEQFRTKEYLQGKYGFYIDYTTRLAQSPGQPVPEPTTLLLLSLGLLGMAGLRKKTLSH